MYGSSKFGWVRYATLLRSALHQFVTTNMEERIINAATAQLVTDLK